MTLEVSIEDMLEEHLKLINLDDFENFWTMNILENELKSENSYYIIAKHKDEIVGFAGINVILEESQLAYIVVRKDLRNRKVGAKLLKAIIEKARKHSRYMTLEVNVKNAPAVRLYKRNKFVVVARRKKYYNRTDDAFLMSKYFF